MHALTAEMMELHRVKI